MGILGLGDHVSALRPEDVQGKKEVSSGSVSKRKTQAWGHLLVAAMTLVRGSAAECVSLTKVKVPPCKGNPKGGLIHCADISYYGHPKLGNHGGPVTDENDNAYLHIKHRQVQQEYVCLSHVVKAPSNCGKDGTVSRELELDFDQCYTRKNFDALINRGDYHLTQKPLEEYMKLKPDQDIKQQIHDQVEPSFTQSRQRMQEMQASPVVATLPNPTVTYHCPGTAPCHILPTVQPAAIR